MSITGEHNLVFHTLSSTHPTNLEALLRSNQHTSSLKRGQVTALVADAESDLVRCDAEISRLHSSIISLENKRKELEIRRDGYKSLMAPIRRLPVETLTNIFRQVSGNERLDTLQGTMSLLVLRMVCAHWHTVALSTPWLWSTISLDHWFAQPILLDLYLKRSGQSPLTLVLNCPFTSLEKTIISRTVQHSNRWLDVTMRIADSTVRSQLDAIQGNLSVLERLNLYIPDAQESAEIFGDDFNVQVFESSPRLHTLSLMGYVYKSMIFPWNQLIHLSRSLCHINQFLRYLRLCPNLETARLEDCWSSLSDDEDDGDEEGVVGHSTTSHLRTFDMCLVDVGEHGGLSVLSTLLSAVTFPSIDTFTIRTGRHCTPDAWPQKPFATFLSRSSCNITTLSMIGLPISDTHLKGILCLLPSLTRLTVKGNPYREITPHAVSDNLVISLNSYSGRSSSLLPNLLFLSLQSYGSAVSDQCFVETIKSRWSPTEPETGVRRVACLRSVVLRVEGRVFDRGTIEPLRHLAKAGMKMSLHDDDGLVQ